MNRRSQVLFGSFHRFCSLFSKILRLFDEYSLSSSILDWEKFKFVLLLLINDLSPALDNKLSGGFPKLLPVLDMLLNFLGLSSGKESSNDLSQFMLATY